MTIWDQREQRAADPIALAVLDMPDVAERDHGLDQMKRRAVVQSDAFAQFGETNAIAIARDFLEDSEGAADRLNPAALAVLPAVMNVMVHIPRAWRCAQRLRAGLR